MKISIINLDFFSYPPPYSWYIWKELQAGFSHFQEREFLGVG